MTFIVDSLPVLNNTANGIFSLRGVGQGEEGVVHRSHVSTEQCSSVWYGTIHFGTVSLDLVCVSTADRTLTCWAVPCCCVALCTVTVLCHFFLQVKNILASFFSGNSCAFYKVHEDAIIIQVSSWEEDKSKWIIVWHSDISLPYMYDIHVWQIILRTSSSCHFDI